LALGVYDLFAVLTPCGPLRQVFRDRAQTNEPPLPVLMYRGTAVECVRSPLFAIYSYWALYLA
jgi:hypothetical protein